MKIVTSLTLVYMVALFAAIVVWLAKCSRKERLKRVKSFKHGKFAFIYISAIPLFFLAYRFNGQPVDGAFWLSIRTCFETVVLKFDFNTIAPLAAQDLLYHIAIEVLFSLVVLNTVMLTLSFCGQWLYNRLLRFITRKFRKNIVAVIGTDKNALDILGSVPKGHKAILFGGLTPELREEVFLRRAAAYNIKDEDDLGVLFQKLFKNFKKRKVSAIMALENDEKSLLYVKQFYQLIETSDLAEIPLTSNCGFRVYVFASKMNADIFAHYVETSSGIIRFINRHKQISMDFIDKYPLTQFMTEREIDYTTATIREGIDLNVFMIGFGKLNESLFLASVSNNQFLTVKGGKLQPKPVTYHIYDRYYPEGKFTEDEEVHSDNLHHGYLRFREFLDYYKGRENEYLEFPPLPAKTVKHALEFTHPGFYSSMRTPLLKENSYNYIIVSFGTDMENIELAEKLQQKIREWEVSAPVKIFVKVRDAKATNVLGGDFENIIFFGANRDCVYNAEIVLREKIEYMARLRHLLYTVEDEAKRTHHSDPFSLSDQVIQEKARKKWYSFHESQRESNIYACLSARMKLQLCGYDYAEDGKDCTKDFLWAYEENDGRTPSALKVAHKTIWEYSNAEQFRNSLRWTLAVQEHLRWCANLIANGFIPSSKQEISSLDKAALLKKRKHGNLTTTDGLVAFRKLVAAASGKTEEETDVIRYDYQLMDDIDWLLKQCGYHLIKKTTAEHQ